MDKIKKYVERFFSSTKKNSEYGMSFSELESGMSEVICATDANGAFQFWLCQRLPVGNSRDEEGRCKGMSKLNDLMQSKYEAMAAMEIPMPDSFEKAMALIRTKLTKKEFMDVESAIYRGCIDSEHKAFEQGFMRGIVVMKGGAV